MVVIFCDKSLPAHQKFLSWLHKYLRHDITFCLHLKGACDELQKCLLYAWRCVVKSCDLVLMTHSFLLKSKHQAYGCSEIVVLHRLPLSFQCYNMSTPNQNITDRIAFYTRELRKQFSFFPLVARITGFYSHRLFLKWIEEVQVLAEIDQYIY